MSVVLEQEEIPEEGGEEKSWSDIMRKRIMQPLLQDEKTCKTAWGPYKSALVAAPGGYCGRTATRTACNY